MVRVALPVVVGLALGTVGTAAAGDHDPLADNGIGNDGLEDPGDHDHGLGNDGWAPADLGGPCADGRWGAMERPEADWVHVSAIDGNDASADGTPDHPFLTIAAAVEAARVLPAGTKRVVAVWPGNYDAGVALLEGEGWDDDVGFVGCSASESVLLAADPDAPILDVAVARDVKVRGLGFIGGTTPLTGRGGARLTVEKVEVSGARGVGIAAYDADTELVVDRSLVAGPALDGCGWGIGSWGADTSISESAVLGARGSAIFADGGRLEVTGGYLVSTSPDGVGKYGRAIHAQYAEVDISWSYISDATDASIFLLQPGGGGVRGVIIDLTAAGIVAQESTGDAIVVSGPTTGRLQIRDNWVYDAARASLILEDAVADVSGNTFSGAGIEPILGADTVGQRRLRVTGGDAASVLWLAAGDELAIDRDPMVCSP